MPHQPLWGFCFVLWMASEVELIHGFLCWYFFFSLSFLWYNWAGTLGSVFCRWGWYPHEHALSSQIQRNMAGALTNCSVIWEFVKRKRVGSSFLNIIQKISLSEKKSEVVMYFDHAHTICMNWIFGQLCKRSMVCIHIHVALNLYCLLFSM